MSGYRKIKKAVMSLDDMKAELGYFWNEELQKGLSPEAVVAKEAVKPRRSGDGHTAPISLWVPPPVLVEGGWHNPAMGGGGLDHLVVGWAEPYTGGRAGIKLKSYQFQHRVASDIIQLAASAAVELGCMAGDDLVADDPQRTTKYATAAARVIQQSLGLPGERAEPPKRAGMLETQAATRALAFAYAAIEGDTLDDTQVNRLEGLCAEADLHSMLLLTRGMSYVERSAAPNTAHVAACRETAACRRVVMGTP